MLPHRLIGSENEVIIAVMLPGIGKRKFTMADLQLYLLLVLKHLRLMVLLMCLSLMLGLTAYVYARPLYHSKDLLYATVIKRPVDTETIYRDSSERSVYSAFVSPQVMMRAAEMMGLKVKTYKELVAKHVAKVSMKTTSEGHFEVDVWAYDYQTAGQMAETMVKAYISYRAERREEVRSRIVHTFETELQELDSRIRGMLESKVDFREQNDQVQIDIEYAQLKQVPIKLAEARFNLKIYENVANLLESGELSPVEKLALIDGVEKDLVVGMGNFVSMSKTGSGRFDNAPLANQNIQAPMAPQIVMPAMVDGESTWKGLDKEFRRIMTEIEKASLKYLEGHPVMQKLLTQKKEVEEALKLEYEVQRDRFFIEYDNLQSKTEQLANKLPAYYDGLRKKEMLDSDSSTFQAGQLAWNRMYEDMSKSLMSFDFGAEKERMDLRYAGKIEQKSFPESPSRVKAAFYAALMGGALAIGVPFLKEFLDHTASTVEQVEDIFKVRGLGIVPKIDEGSAASSGVTASRQETHILENFRVIRTNLLMGGSRSAANKVIVVTSSMPQEGKTVVSSNLSISFGNTGEKTLLIDADLRRGRLHRKFGIDGTQGLSSYLKEEKVTIDSIICKTANNNLDLIPAGRHIEGATELFGSRRFKDFLEDLRQRYDRIIIDTPPVLGLPETSMIQPFVDATVFVLWSGKTPMELARTAIELLKSNGANFYGFVLNRLDLNKVNNYYYYYYYSYEYYDSYRHDS